ncbi:hypothetical protein PR048_025654 [Dryococelus australis]|uniref:Uncharacterized protein n=1 Tax=Dryococelus australis TaxID=614101 RepID=A0ABQ9GJ58_9NEOP|nr:hypothetical protein PR048_025654 [Dryococelus australis]
MSVYTRQKAKSQYRNRIRLERASLKQSSGTHKTPYDRVKRCRERAKLMDVTYGRWVFSGFHSTTGFCHVLSDPAVVYASRERHSEVKSGEIWVTLNNERRNARAGGTGDPEKTRRPAASSGTIATCANLEAIWPGIEPSLPRWEASSLTTTPRGPFQLEIAIIWRAGAVVTQDSHSGGPGFDSRSGHPDFGFPWFSENTQGECWYVSLTKAMADSFPNPSFMPFCCPYKSQYVPRARQATPVEDVVEGVEGGGDVFGESSSQGGRLRSRNHCSPFFCLWYMRKGVLTRFKYSLELSSDGVWAFTVDLDVEPSLLKLLHLCTGFRVQAVPVSVSVTREPGSVKDDAGALSKSDVAFMRNLCSRSMDVLISCLHPSAAFAGVHEPNAGENSNNCQLVRELDGSASLSQSLDHEGRNAVRGFSKVFTLHVNSLYVLCISRMVYRQGADPRMDSEPHERGQR